jgi:hypothetical protein
MGGGCSRLGPPWPGHRHRPSRLRLDPTRGPQRTSSRQPAAAVPVPWNGHHGQRGPRGSLDGWRPRHPPGSGRAILGGSARAFQLVPPSCSCRHLRCSRIQVVPRSSTPHARASPPAESRTAPHCGAPGQRGHPRRRCRPREHRPGDRSGKCGTGPHHATAGRRSQGLRRGGAFHVLAVVPRGGVPSTAEPNHMPGAVAPRESRSHSTGRLCPARREGPRVLAIGCARRPGAHGATRIRQPLALRRRGLAAIVARVISGWESAQSPFSNEPPEPPCQRGPAFHPAVGVVLITRTHAGRDPLRP